MATNIDIIALSRPQVVVSNREARDLSELFYSDVYIQSAYRLIETFLLGTGLRLASTDKSKAVDSTFESIIREFWMPFVREVLPDLIVYGYVVWTKAEKEYLEGKKRKSVYVPVVVPRSCYDLHVLIGEDYSKTYEVTPVNSSPRENADLHVFLLPGREPDVTNGLHRSIVSTLNHQAKCLRMMESWFFRATQQLAHPPLLYEEAEMATKLRQPFTGFVFDPDLNSVTSKKEGELINTDGGRIEVAPRASIDARIENEIFLRNRQTVTSLQTPEDNYHFVPPGFKVSDKPAPEPQPQKDLLSYTDAFRDRVYACFQVPVTLVFAQLNTRSGSSALNQVDDTDMQRLNRVLQIYQESILRLCHQTYIEILEGEDDGVEFKLPIFVHLSITQAFTLADQDTISDKDARKIALRISGLEDEMLLRGHNEHKRPRLGGNENMTLPMIEARVGNINAETDLLHAKIGEVKAGIEKTKTEAALNRKEEKMPMSASGP